jgi:hypothetical protein
VSSLGVPPPGGRARSNALSGPADPRNPDTQKIFQLQLANAKPIADSLRSFLLKVYAKKSLMTDQSIQKWPIGPDGKPVSPQSRDFGDTLSDKLYALYTAEAKVPSGRTEEDMRKIIQSLQLLETKYSSALAGVQSQNYKLDFDGMLKYTGADFITVCGDFIFFFPVGGGRAAIRVYANAKYGRITEVIEALLAWVKANPAKHGLANFKIAGPAMPKRSDTMVIYCVNTQAADLISELLLGLPDCFDMAVPEMTSRKHGTIGISTGAEPNWQATGLGAHMGEQYESNVQLQARHGVGGAAYAPQSFGTLRCQAIAAAILNFQMNLDQIRNTFDEFARFVSVAFTGMGLDPSNPGD